MHGTHRIFLDVRQLRRPFAVLQRCQTSCSVELDLDMLGLVSAQAADSDLNPITDTGVICVLEKLSEDCLVSQLLAARTGLTYWYSRPNIELGSLPVSSAVTTR